MYMYFISLSVRCYFWGTHMLPHDGLYKCSDSFAFEAMQNYFINLDQNTSTHITKIIMRSKFATLGDPIRKKSTDFPIHLLSKTK